MDIQTSRDNNLRAQDTKEHGIENVWPEGRNGLGKRSQLGSGACQTWDRPATTEEE